MRAMTIVNDPINASRSKHVGRKFHSSRMCVCRRDSDPLYRNEISIRGYSYEGTMA